MTTYVFRMSIVAKFYTDVFSLPIVEPNPTIIIGYLKLPDSNSIIGNIQLLSFRWSLDDYKSSETSGF